MEKLEIQHSFVEVKGLKLHVAEIGTGSKVVLFLHGFPEIWYSWRHQMVAVAEAGYRAIAIDCRGYGLSDHPPESEKTIFNEFVDDVVCLLDSLNISKAFIVGKDSGSILAFHFAVVHPDRVVGVISLGISFMLPGHFQLSLLPKGFYVLRWREPGRAEADFGRFDIKTVIKNIYILFSGTELQIASDDQEIMDLVDPSTPLPPWFSEEDLDVYASLYEKSGFRTPLNVPYRSIDIDCGVTDPKITAPSLLIMGEKDYFIKFPGVEDFMRNGSIKQFMPNLDIVFMPEGNHFVQEQLPQEVNKLIITFLNKHYS